MVTVTLPHIRTLHHTTPSVIHLIHQHTLICLFIIIQGQVL